MGKIPKLKEIVVAPYWHLEMFIAIPIVIIWTTLLVLIWLK